MMPGIVVFFCEACNDVPGLLQLHYRIPKCQESAPLFPVDPFCRLFQGIVRILHVSSEYKKNRFCNLFLLLEFQFLFDLFYLVFKLLICFNKVIHRFTGM